MEREKLVKYARLLLSKGVSLKEGGTLLILADTEAAPFAQIIAAEAYKMGAKDVAYQFKDDEIDRMRYMSGDIDSLCTIPPHQIDGKAYYAERGACVINLTSSDPDRLSGIDSDRINGFLKANAEAQKPYRELTQKMGTRQVIAACAGKKWADKLFPSCEDSVEKLWECILKCCYADLENPEEYWDRHSSAILERGRKLTEMGLKQLHFTSSNGTDLIIKLAEDCVWGGGGSDSKDGTFYVPNIPTEECFTCPHRLGVDGKVVATKPLSYGGGLIENFSITYKDGKMVQYSAEKGGEILKGIFSTDEGAMHLGEVALVDFESPINKSGVLFYNTLYDENAVCHLAIGNAYPFTVKVEEGGKTAEEKGLNKSSLHIDFMFGSRDMKCVGVDRDGKEVLIMENGSLLF